MRGLSYVAICNFVRRVRVGFDAGNEAVSGNHADDFLNHCMGWTVMSYVQVYFKVIQLIVEPRTQFSHHPLGEIKRYVCFLEHTVVMIVRLNSFRTFPKISSVFADTMDGDHTDKFSVPDLSVQCCGQTFNTVSRTVHHC